MMQTSFVALSEPGPDVAQIDDRVIPVDGGEITVRVYTPDGDGPFPAHVYFHGGGFWLGDLDFSDGTCRELCDGAKCVVVSVDYRLAPEHTYPTAPEDSYAALLWTVAHADELGIDTTRVSVGGASAGGNLAAVVALMARDRSGPPLVAQVLEIPVTDLTMSQPSVVENGEGYLLTRDRHGDVPRLLSRGSGRREAALCVTAPRRRPEQPPACGRHDGGDGPAARRR